VFVLDVARKETDDGYGGAGESKGPDTGDVAAPQAGPVGYVFVEPDVDGSDDIFTRVALRDVLHMRDIACPADEGVKKVLIVDEVCEAHAAGWSRAGQ
jgi:hypothetical protein